MSVYANRWGGPRYRTEELAKFLNKHLYNIQEDQLKIGKKVNTVLSHDAFLSSRHTPVYMTSIQVSPTAKTFLVVDELGFECILQEDSEILVYKNDQAKFEKVKNLKTGDQRVINFELVDAFSNDKLHHHRVHSGDFFSIKYKNEYEKQMLLCDSLSAMTILKDEDKILKRIDQFDSKNIQEIYIIDIINISEIKSSHLFFKTEFSPFSYFLKKNRELSDKSKNRYWKQRTNTAAKRWLEKMRSKVFRIKKNKIDFEMELTHEEDRN